jgi:hypothetical protein
MYIHTIGIYVKKKKILNLDIYHNWCIDAIKNKSLHDLVIYVQRYKICGASLKKKCTYIQLEFT